MTPHLGRPHADAHKKAGKKAGLVFSGSCLGALFPPLADRVRQLDLDLQRGDGIAALHLHLHLVGRDIDMAGDDAEDLLPELGDQIAGSCRDALVLQQDLQPVTGYRRGARRLEEIEDRHAALRPKSLLMKPRRSDGTTMGMISPSSRLAASR